LHGGGAQTARVGEDGEGITFERPVAEDIQLDK